VNQDKYDVKKAYLAAHTTGIITLHSAAIKLCQTGVPNVATAATFSPADCGFAANVSLGRAMQVDATVPMLKAPGAERFDDEIHV
jgi:hypothetical protein